MLILENDTNAEVRRAVLSCIAISPRTLPRVLKRTRDVKENVRKLAYQVDTSAVVRVCIFVFCYILIYFSFVISLPCFKGSG